MRGMMFLPKSCGRVLLGVGDQLLPQAFRAKQIDAHRDEGFGGIAGDVSRVRGLFIEFLDSEILVDADDAEPLGFLDRDVQGADDHIRILVR